jgi:hypothetical protein
MALDPQPFIDLGYLVATKPGEDDITEMSVYGHGPTYLVTEENYDSTLATTTELHDNRNQLKAAWNAFHDNYDKWPTMTAAQKDAANRNAQRAIAHLIRNFAEDV